MKISMKESECCPKPCIFKVSSYKPPQLVTLYDKQRIKRTSSNTELRQILINFVYKFLCTMHYDGHSCRYMAWKYCRYGIKHKTITQSIIANGLIANLPVIFSSYRLYIVIILVLQLLNICVIMMGLFFHFGE